MCLINVSVEMTIVAHIMSPCYNVPTYWHHRRGVHTPLHRTSMFMAVVCMVLVNEVVLKRSVLMTVVSAVV